MASWQIHEVQSGNIPVKEEFCKYRISLGTRKRCENIGSNKGNEKYIEIQKNRMFQKGIRYETEDNS